AQLQADSTIQIPSEQEATVALAGSGQAAPAAGVGTGAPPPLGAYTVRAGDTLSGIAASSGINLGELAWMNGLDPGAPLLAGTALKLPTGSPLAVQAATTTVETTVVPPAAPYATPGRVTAEQISQIAAANGVSPSLA